MRASSLRLTARLLAVFTFAAISIAGADPIPVRYICIRSEGYAEGFRGHGNDKETPSLLASFVGKPLSAVSPVQKITVWHDFDEQVSDQIVRQKLPPADFLWILEHYEMRAPREQDWINVPLGTMIDVHYKNGFILRINTLEKSAYGGSLISPLGKHTSVGFGFLGGK